MPDLIVFLVGGDLRSDGRADDAAAMVLSQPERFQELLSAFEEPEAVKRIVTFE